MEAIKDVGKIVLTNDKDPLWQIPNFYDLPQEHNTVIRSPRFRYNDTEWYMEVYPDGRKLYSSSGWFGISVLNLNINSNFRNVTFGIIGDDKKDNIIFTVGESNGEGFYSCIRFLPRLFLKSRKDLFAKGGDLCLLFSIDSLNNYEDDAIYIIQLITEDAQEWFKELQENTSFELSIRGKEENEMPFQTDVGEILTDPNDAKWTIPNFWDLSHEYNSVIRSPRFHFVDRHWYMDVYPNGRRSHSSLGWFGINVWNLNSDSSLRSVTVCVMDENSNKSCLLFSKDSRDNGSYCCTRLFPISLLKCWKDVVTPKGNLCLLLQIETEDDINTLGMRVASKYVHKWFKEKFENKDRFIETSTQTEGETVKEDIKQIYDDTCPAKSTEGKKGNVRLQDPQKNSITLLSISPGVTVEKTANREKNTPIVSFKLCVFQEKLSVEGLRQDFKEILLSGNISDIILKVEGQEFKAHKSILGARSPVFLAMMMHETKEKISGTVDIPDVDANIFPDFLSYLYTGSKDNLTSENAAKLYTVADKYQVNELKESCKDLMLMNISIDNFCDILTLSLRHDEKKLKEACNQFFAKNSLDIVLTYKWKTFLCENPITGNELFIKHLKLNK